MNSNHGKISHRQVHFKLSQRIIISKFVFAFLRLTCKLANHIFFCIWNIIHVIVLHDNYSYRDSCRPEMIQELLAHDCNVLSCGESHVAMVTMEGKVFVWGCGDCGRLGTGSGDHW